MAYRVDFMLSIISIIFVVMMQIYMWKAIYKDSSDVLFTYSYTQMLMYTVLASLVSKLTMVDMETAQTIKSGDLSKYLIKPINYFFNTLIYCVGKRFFISLTVTTLVLIVVFIFKLLFAGTVYGVHILLFFCAVLLGFVINVLLNFMISMATFWFSSVNNLFSTVYIVQLMLSGGIFPLDIFGDTTVMLSKLLPFQYTIQFPINILTNKLSMGDIAMGYGVQTFWICLCSVLGYFLWRRGLKRYMAVGG